MKSVHWSHCLYFSCCVFDLWCFFPVLALNPVPTKSAFDQRTSSGWHFGNARRSTFALETPLCRLSVDKYILKWTQSQSHTLSINLQIISLWFFFFNFHYLTPLCESSALASETALSHKPPGNNFSNISQMYFIYLNGLLASLLNNVIFWSRCRCTMADHLAGREQKRPAHLMNEIVLFV